MSLELAELNARLPTGPAFAGPVVSGNRRRSVICGGWEVGNSTPVESRVGRGEACKTGKWAWLARDGGQVTHVAASQKSYIYVQGCTYIMLYRRCQVFLGVCVCVLILKVLVCFIFYYTHV